MTPLVNFLQTYGYLALGLSAFVAAFGVPLPLTLALLAAGAFSAQGDFNFALLGVIAISASVAGDCLGYLVGRLWGSKVLAWLQQSRLGGRFIKPQAIDHSRLYFKQYGGWTILLTRTLLTALGSVTNLVAGAELFPFQSFLFFDVVGEATGAILALVLGFVFGASWEAVGDVYGAVPLLALGLVGILVVTHYLLRYLKARNSALATEQRQGDQAPRVE